MADIRERFATEMRTFEERRAALVAEGGERQWVVVEDAKLLGPYPTADAAWHAGIDTFGKPGFMLKQVFRVDRPEIVSQFRLDLPARS